MTDAEALLAEVRAIAASLRLEADRFRGGQVSSDDPRPLDRRLAATADDVDEIAWKIARLWPPPVDALRAEIRAVLDNRVASPSPAVAFADIRAIVEREPSAPPLSAANVVRTIAGMFSATNRQHMAEWLVDCADAIERGVPWPKLKPKPVPLPDSETERPQRCPETTPSGDVITEGRQCQQYEGHPHDHTWYGDNGSAHSRWARAEREANRDG